MTPEQRDAYALERLRDAFYHEPIKRQRFKRGIGAANYMNDLRRRAAEYRRRFEGIKHQEREGATE